MRWPHNPMNENTIGGCVKRWQQTVNNRNHWQVDDGWSTAGTFVTFPGPKIDTLKAFISGRDVIVILPTGFGKSLIFQLFWEVKLASNPNTCILVVAPLNSIVEDQISVNGVSRPTRLLRFVAFVHLPFSFRSLDLLCRFTLVYEGHFVLCC